MESFSNSQFDSQSQGEASGCGTAPNSKKGKRMCKWKEEWKRYNMKGSKRGGLLLLIATLISPLVLGVSMK